MSVLGTLSTEIAMASRLLGGLRGFLRTTSGDDECRARLLAARESRVPSFLQLIAEGMLARPSSPYRALLERARITGDDLARWIGRDGLETTLSRLYAEGVYLTIDEFKGRRPIVRGSLTIAARAKDFDNPLLTRHYETRSGGSRGRPTRLIVDLDLLAHEACHERVFLTAFGLTNRPIALWHPAPPGSAGLKLALRFARLGLPPERWFSQSAVSARSDLKHALFVRSIVQISRTLGQPLPRPEHVTIANAVVVARWLAEKRAAGTPAFLSTTASAAVRLCLAAQEAGLDISGSFLRTGGEPVTPAKVAALQRAGCLFAPNYGMAEVGRIGNACARPNAPDDTHLAMDKLAIVPRPDATPTEDGGIPVLLSTTLSTVPKILLNVEIGDAAVTESRHCACPWDTLGYNLHVRQIRSYEKATSDGMHFIGADFADLVDRVLPDRFGGSSVDYQFVEEEVNGLPRVTLFVSARVGQVDHDAILAVTLNTLAATNVAHGMMSKIWRDAATLRVRRAEPIHTRTGKTLPLHVIRYGART